MWPFNKKLDTNCTSGTFIHDDKHHLWGHWKSYILEGIAYSILFRSGVPLTELHQRRECQICGFIEDEKI